MKEISGTVKSYRTEDISEWLRSSIVTRATDIMGESKIPILDMAGNLVEEFRQSGIEIVTFNFENFSMPEALEKALDESTSLHMLGKNMDIYERKAQSDALRDAAKNTGTAGGMMGAGLGMGMGMRMAQAFGGPAYGQPAAPAAPATIKCPSCSAQIASTSKFCPECGAQIKTFCSACGTKVAPGTKFCPECGGRI